MKEIWKEYVTYGRNRYGDISYTITDIEVSNYGNVRGTLWNKKPLKDVYIENNRRRISNSHDGQIFVIVWKVFNGPVPKGYVIHHKDHNSLNDRLDNLELMSRVEHVRHHRLMASAEWNEKIGKANKGHKTFENHKHTEESKLKMSESKKGNKNSEGRRWFNNGIITICVKKNESAPEGFVSGRLKKIKIPK